MKQGHLLLIFLLLYCSCFLGLLFERKSYDEVIEKKQKTEQALLDAIEYTANRYRDVIKDTEEKKKQVIDEAFSEAFYVTMGLFQSTQPEELWRIYIPMLVLVEEDGAYFYYVKGIAENPKQELVHVWTDKISFDFSDVQSAAGKKAILADLLEEKASQIISNHNFIAKQYGISYSFSLPAFFQDTSREPEFPMLFVVFQGWPLNSYGTIFYENCLDAGVFLREKRIDTPVFIKSEKEGEIS